MSYTETETVTHAMRKSGLLASDETPSADDLSFAQKIYRSRIAALKVRGVQLWGLTADDIPEEYLDPISDYIAMFLLASHGGPRPIDDQVIAAEHSLRQLSSPEPTGEIIEATYF